MQLLTLVDFSETTPRVLDTASELAEALSAKLLVMHAVAPDPEFVGFDVGPASMQQNAHRDLSWEESQLKQIVDDLAAAGHDVAPLLVQGPIVEKVVAEAKHLRVDYIVIGSHGHGALYHMLMGSITQGVLREAPCPVVVVPPPGRGA